MSCILATLQLDSNKIEVTHKSEKAMFPFKMQLDNIYFALTEEMALKLSSALRYTIQDYDMVIKEKGEAQRRRP